MSGGVKGPKALTLIAVTLLVAQLALADDWKPVLGHLMTRWAKDVNPQAPLLGYPRPQLRRGNWKNLNGLWDYAVTALEAPPGPAGYGALSTCPTRRDAISRNGWFRKLRYATVNPSGASKGSESDDWMKGGPLGQAS